MNKFEQIILKILNTNFSSSTIKCTYLYNEFFISMSKTWEFVLLWISYKSSKIQINKYKWEDTRIWKILLILLKKYEEIFLNYFKIKQKTIFNLWEESEFINIFDKKELNYENIEEKLYFSFLDDYSYRRRSEMSFNIEEKSIIDIYHSDFECSKCAWPREAFTNFIDYHNHEVCLEKSFRASENNTKKINLYTNITDYESITIWWNAKIDEILQNIELINEYDIISINKTCISVIMWDDIESILKHNNISKEKTIYTDQNTDSWYRVIINYLKTLDILKVSKNNELVFFWLNKNKNTFELIKFLQNNFWLQVWNVLLPNINKKDLENILRYKLAVFFIGRETKTQNIFKLYPIDNLEINVPYGISKTYELYESILLNYWLEEEKLKLKNIFNELREKNIELFNKSKKYNIWFIIHDFHIKQFSQDNFRGCSIISMLNDMGFHLNFFIYLASDKSKEDIIEFNAKNDLYNFYTIISNKKADLDKFINDENIQIYYSEISSDSRIISKNKWQFSVWDLEYWIDWFYRSLELLIKKCEKVDYMNSKLNYYLK